MKRTLSQTLAAALLALWTTCAAAGDLERALQFMEENAPVGCEIQTLRMKARRAPPGSPEREALERSLYETALRFERGNRAAREEMESILRRLSREDRERVMRRSAALTEKCLGPLGAEPDPAPPAMPAQ